jgi:PAS domain S-box-containing protein
VRSDERRPHTTEPTVIGDAHVTPHDGGLGTEPGFRRCFEIARIGMVVMSPALRIQDVNDTLCEILGYERRELVYTPWNDLTHPDDVHPAGVARVVAGNVDGDSTETRLRGKDGRVIHARLSVKVIRAADGRVDHLTGVVQDITEEKQAAASLAERAQQQTALYGFVARLHRADSLTEVHDAALDAILDALGCDRASLLLCDPAGAMRFVGWRGLSEAYRDAVEGHCPWTLTDPNPQPVCVPDVVAADLHPDLRAIVQKEGIGALAFIPLVASGTLIGKFMTYYDAPHAFGAAEIDLGLSIARQLALSIDRRRADEALRAAYVEARKRQREAESLAGVARTLNTLNLDAMLQIIADSACALLEAEAATVFRQEPESGSLILVAGGGPRGTTTNRNVTVPPGAGLVGLAVASREAVVSPNILTDERLVYEPAMRARVEATRHRVGLAVPLMVQGRTIGALFVGRLPGSTFEEDDVRLAAAFANQAAAAMANAELYHQAQRANQAKDDFLAMLGHELRNPLGAITGAASVLKVVGADDPAAARARGVIDRQTQHLSRLVDDLLDVARVTTGKVRLNLQPVDLGELVGSAMSAWRATSRFAHHHVSADVVSIWVDGDETRLEQVLDNLVGNALKYTPPGGQVIVRVSDADGDAVVEVADTGPGIPAHLRETIFDLFVQGERALDRAQGGLGIGLTLVKALVRLHGGTVAVASAAGPEGSLFTIRLPRIAAPATAGRGASPPAARRTTRRILVVEDNEDAREILRMQLRLEGHEVHEAADGPSGVAATAAVAPDVVLIDVGLPGLDGYEVARRIRTTPEGKDVVLIALTGYGQAEDRRRALAAGFDVHLTKPVVPDHLARAIANAAAARGPVRAA